MESCLDPSPQPPPSRGGGFLSNPGNLMASISLRQIDKSYGEHQVLFGCDLDIADHEFVVLVGPSGSGKTRCYASSPGSRTSVPASCASATRG